MLLVVLLVGNVVAHSGELWLLALVATSGTGRTDGLLTCGMELWRLALTSIHVIVKTNKTVSRMVSEFDMWCM
jgi:hypothetical protein